MKLVILSFTLLTGITYLIWRWCGVWLSPTDSGWIYYGLELFIGVCSLFYWRTLYLGSRLDLSPPVLLTPVDMQTDILIPTANEDSALLLSTILGAKKILKKNLIYVLDDGNRAWLRTLCNEQKVEYLARGVTTDAKAGNLNYALKIIKSDFALILDADMVPSPDILELALPHFNDNSVAIVQFPQEFSNLDSFQHWEKGKTWHDLTFGLKTVNPCRNYFKASYWVGSPSIIRLKTFREIGGVQTGSVTEDVQTTIALMANGSWIKSLTQIQAMGVAPCDYDAYCIQRQRWSKGFFQLWWSKQCPLFQRLSLSSKIEWVGDFFYHFHMSFYFLLLQVFPFYVLYTGDSFLPPDFKGLLLFWGMTFFLMNLCNKILAGEHYRIIPTQVYMRLAMVPIVWGFFESLPFFNSKVFEVTPKNKTDKLNARSSFYHGFFILLLFINVFGLFLALKWDFTLMSLFLLLWCAVNAFYLFLGALKILSTSNFVS